MLLAFLAGMSVGQIAIAIVVIAAIVAVVFVALRQFNVAIPSWVVHVFWILVVAAVCILAIRFLLTL
jgi:uncharacterized protein (DUF983 family)